MAYLAPYYRLPPGQNTSCNDLIYFRDGHTIDKHLEAIGETFESYRATHQSYLISAPLYNDDLLERVRRDPGVEKVVQVTRQMEKAARSQDR